MNSTVLNGSKKVGDIIKSTANAVDNKWKESSTTAKTFIIGGATATAAPFIIVPVLGVVGFTPAGVAAGSVAASVQTAATTSGSVFALCQSAGATGAVAGPTLLGVVLGSGATAGGLIAALYRKRSDNRNNGDNEQTETEEEMNSQEVRDGPFVFPQIQYKPYLLLSKI